MARQWQWDDVRIFLAVSREGTFSGAARALGVDHVTSRGESRRSRSTSAPSC